MKKRLKSIKKVVTFRPTIGDENDSNKYSGKSEAAQTLIPHSSSKKQVDSVVENVVSITGRRMRASAMRRRSSQLKRIRQIASAQVAPEQRLLRRAQRLARGYVKRRYAGNRGKSYRTASLPDKLAVDNVVNNNQSMMKRLSSRLLPQVRKAEYLRLQGRRRKEVKKRINNAAGIGIINSSYDPIITEKYARVHPSLKNPGNHVSQAPTQRLHKQANAMIAKMVKATKAAQPKPAATKPTSKKSSSSGKKTSTGKAKPKVGRGKHNNHRMPTQKPKLVEIPKRKRTTTFVIHGGTNTFHGMKAEGRIYNLRKKATNLQEAYSSFDPPKRLEAAKALKKTGVTQTVRKVVPQRSSHELNPRSPYANAYKPKKDEDGIVKEMVSANDNYANDNHPNANDNTNLVNKPEPPDVHPSVVEWANKHIKKSGSVGVYDAYQHYANYCDKQGHDPIGIGSFGLHFSRHSGSKSVRFENRPFFVGVSLKGLHESTKPPPLPRTTPPPLPPTKKRPFSNLINKKAAAEFEARRGADIASQIASAFNDPPPPKTISDFFKKKVILNKEATIVHHLKALDKTLFGSKYSRKSFLKRYKKNLKGVQKDTKKADIPAFSPPEPLEMKPAPKGIRLPRRSYMLPRK